MPRSSDSTADSGLLHIGEVAERTGLSVRTIRHYEEVGLITPCARSVGGFRLYTDTDLDRLLVVKDMKPLGFSLQEMRQVVTILDGISAGGAEVDQGLVDQLRRINEDAQQRIAGLEQQLIAAQRFADRLQLATSPSRSS